MNNERNLEIIASADTYWTRGVELIKSDRSSFDLVVGMYEVELVQGFADKKYRLEHIRKIVQAASMLDGEASRMMQDQGMSLTDENILEAQARRLAHHALRQTRNTVSTQSGVKWFQIDNAKK